MPWSSTLLIQPEMEVPTLSKTLKSPDLNEESLDPRIIIALFEIGSLPPVACSSLPSLKNSDHEATEQRIAKKFENLLKEIKDIVKHMTGYEEKVIETKESFEETNISEDVSELKEKIKELDKINKVLLEKLLASWDLGKEQNSKKQEMMLENQNSKDTMQGCARDLVNCSEEKRALHETQLSKEKAKHRYPLVQEENIKLRDNMEQLLQEAKHWSVQHTELSELIKSYQKSQTDIKTLENNGAHSPTQTNNGMSAKHELEEQVRKLKQDTYSLHLIAALLENECQILEQRVELLKELHHQKEGPLQGEPIQINYEQNKKEQKLSEAEKVKIHKQNMQEMFQKGDQFCRSLDVCHKKKARNNLFNTHIARRALVGKKRPASSLS
ncbi:Spermatogenic leucine zipper protein 1, partial [Eschrichtius robustus]|nr:Spermatogenic leucine zipper protein 1 [Eschrichtius robustus]